MATVNQQTIALSGNVPNGVTLRLSDRLIDLDQAVTVTLNGKTLVAKKPLRTAAAIRASLEEQFDPAAAASATWILP